MICLASDAIRIYAWSALAILVIAAAERPALAVRPFVTDDARVADYGQIEAETWLEIARRAGYTKLLGTRRQFGQISGAEVRRLPAPASARGTRIDI